MQEHSRGNVGTALKGGLAELGKRFLFVVEQ